ncbi:hypothetical protein HAZT_HAZT009377 [Hyalella azteca]|uniref:Ig-like domain-containing protein n=1 Tax=Hyalella azteca TaxID=294128 RepID=A0A6A0GQ63_HYAAZ|nr:hypothetical protein HAZT_HAZT009377 [Hyalella azteca]
MKVKELREAFDQLKVGEVNSSLLKSPIHSVFPGNSNHGSAGYIATRTRKEIQDSSHELPLLWIAEPKSTLVFSNDSGALLHCAAHAPGGPPPTVAWTTVDGRPFLPVSGLVEQLSNGSLWFLPFPSHRFDASLHRVIISCTVACDRGALISRPSAVTPVIRQDYVAQVQGQMVMAGNSALLECHLPEVEEGVLVVTSWLREDNINILPSLYGGELISGLITWWR